MLAGRILPSLAGECHRRRALFDEELHLALSLPGRRKDYYATRTCTRQAVAVLHYRCTPCATRSICAHAHVRPTYRICTRATQCKRLLGIHHINGDRYHCRRRASESPTTTTLRSHNAYHIREVANGPQQRQALSPMQHSRCFLPVKVPHSCCKIAHCPI